MKLKSKLLLCATSLLTVSVAATATSAYAWFTANRVANLTYNEVTTMSQSTSLKVKLDTTSDASDYKGNLPKNDFIRKAGSTGDGTSSTTKYELTSKGNKTGLVSGNGVDTSFKAPIYDESQNNYPIKGFEADVTGRYYTFNYEFEVEGQESVALYLAPSSDITKKDSSTIDLTSSVRMAVVDASGSDESLLFYGNPYGTTTENSYLTGGDSAGTALASLKTTPVTSTLIGTSAAAVAGDNAKHASVFNSAFGSNLTEASVNKTASDDMNYTNKSLGYIDTITYASGSSTTRTLTFRFWLEGLYATNAANDVTVDLSASNYAFDIALNFYILTISNIK